MSSHTGQLGQCDGKTCTMTAANAVTQPHSRADLTSVRKFKSCVHFFSVMLLRVSSKTKQRVAAQSGGYYCGTQRSECMCVLTKLSNSGFDENKGFSART